MTQNNIFDIRKSPVDGKYRVWTTKSVTELGIVSETEFRRLGEPVYLQSPVPVVVGVFDKKPTITEALALFEKSPRKRR